MLGVHAEDHRRAQRQLRPGTPQGPHRRLYFGGKREGNTKEKFKSDIIRGTTQVPHLSIFQRLGILSYRQEQTVQGGGVLT